MRTRKPSGRAAFSIRLPAGFWGLVLALSCAATPALALAPMEYFHTLVAGGNDAAFRDGPFARARFDHPSGLAFDASGKRLFVSDRNNHRIRVIDLRRENRVGTFAGTGKAGKEDGPLEKASFNHPTALAWFPPDNLAVYDEGNQSLRVLDLRAKTVSTLKFTPPDSLEGPVWNLVYSPKHDSLFISEPEMHVLQRLDLKSRRLTKVISGSEKLPAPRALCVSGGKLYVADKILPTVYRLELTDAKDPVGTFSLEPAGRGENIMAMAGYKDRVYALQKGEVPCARVSPDYQPVSIGSAWGFFINSDNPGMPSLLALNDDPVGFAASPNEERKFYLTKVFRSHSILSLKDYDHHLYWNPHSSNNEHGYLTDFNYPAQKPPKTFRILVAGNSRMLNSPDIVPGASRKTSQAPNGDLDWRVNIFTKQLEFLLNTQGALQNQGKRFEVLTLGHPGLNPVYFANEEMPALVAAYDIDLVILFGTSTRVEKVDAYFTKPLTAEGIPALRADPEYILRPFQQRIPEGAPRRFYERCKKKGWVKENNSTQFSFWEFGAMIDSGDKEIRADLLELFGKPLGIFGNKLRKMKTKEGLPVRFGYCYAPSEDLEGSSEDAHEAFWTDLAREQKWPLLNLTDSYNTLRTAYFPTVQECCHHHYTVYGNSLVAQLLGHFLIQGKWVAFPWVKP